MNIEVPIEELRKKKLMLATPMYGGACAGMYAKSVADLSALCTQYGISLQLYFLFNESLITRARNYCCDEFMRSEATHLMFIDSDIGFNPQDVLALMALSSEDSQYDIIGGPYPKKCISWEKIKHAVDKGVADKDPGVLENFVGDYVFNPKGGQQTIALNEPVEVLEIGTGFMMMRKNSFNKFKEAFPQYSYKPDHVRTAHFDGSREIMQYFQAEVDKYDPRKDYEALVRKIVAGETVTRDEAEAAVNMANKKIAESSNRYLSEDYWFCQKAQNIGLRTWLCPWMKLMHVGSYIFGGSLADLASVGAAATADPSLIKK
jgi:hypothetical protein